MSEQSPDVVLVNPNTNRATTAMITGPEALADATRHVVALVQDLVHAPEGAPMVVVAAFADPGVPELRDAGYRVTGIGEAALQAAAAGGRRFAVATTTPDLAEAICGLVDRAGVADLFTGVELTTTDPLMLAEDPEACREELDAVVWRCLAAGAQRVVIGGGPLSDAAADLAGRYPDVIVEPLTAAAAVVAYSRHS
ncbi:aspartate/glutamate racemase family protein [Corynebacterium variabile]|uniref:aspartate/glutamate racemase family protein n=1 Tax=Corynebacterium variabile TaxID=1727 RepID=UPI0028A11981|nr:aspartate/glutamate racemase family protein [Corynebacterium variabile]